jgi:hypothetical protein
MSPLRQQDQHLQRDKFAPVVARQTERAHDHVMGLLAIALQQREDFL